MIYNIIKIVNYMGSHKGYIHWMYQDFVLLLVWWWLLWTKHVAKFLVLLI